MKDATRRQIVDFVEQATLVQGDFHTLYDLGNGTVLSISRNALTGGSGRFYATLPIVSGVEDWGRAEDWQSLNDVAQRIETLSE